MASGIYCIENLDNNKKYIGFATNLESRKTDHISALRSKRHDNPYLQNVWNKHGEKSFKFWVIEEYPKNEEILKLMEIYFIAYYNSYRGDGGGYNLTRGGDGSFGYKHTEESLEKISKNRIYKRGKDHPNYGKSPSEESRNKASKSSKNNPVFKTINLGKKASEETRKKQSAARLGKPTIKSRKNFSSQYYGVSWSEKNKRWICYKTECYKVKNLGSFINEMDAARRWDRYIIENSLEEVFPLNFPKNYVGNKKLFCPFTKK